jgi:uncharacterized protein
VNFNIDNRTILKVKHGSHAYGTNTPTSDLDVKGVAIEPMTHQLGFLHTFEQHEKMGGKDGDLDLVIYSLKKFAKLAADCNPNIIEVLHVDESDVLFADEFGERLREIGDSFLSKKAKFTFAGYAHAQLKRIKTHRAWLLDPPKVKPTREEFKLSTTFKVQKSELGAFDAAIEQGVEMNLSKEVLTLFTREKQYQSALTHWDQYQNWVATRNPARAELEAKYGYDTKHGMHLLRLMRMCKEILVEGKVRVKRPDAEELLRVRYGLFSYDELIEQAERLETECDALYETSTVLPREPDRVKLDQFIVDLTLDYVKEKGM